MTRDPPDPRFPNLFVIGAPKCATTTLHSALSAVPDVFMTAVKEPGFFSTNHHYDRGTRHYLDSFFPEAQRFPLRGESTPWYLYSAAARERIQEDRREAAVKFVVLIRQPTDRAYSMFLDQQRAGLEHRSFEQAVDEELNSSAADQALRLPHRRYLWASRYSPHLHAWRTTFGTASVGVFLTGDLRQPESFWAELSSFLGADLGSEELSGLPRGRMNTAGGRRWPWVDRALRLREGRRGRVAGAVQRVVPYAWYRRAVQAIWSMNAQEMQPASPGAGGGQASRPPPSLLAALDEHFRPEVGALEHILDRPLAQWLPENIPRD